MNALTQEKVTARATEIQNRARTAGPMAISLTALADRYWAERADAENELVALRETLAVSNPEIVVPEVQR